MSIAGQLLDRQRRALTEAGCLRVFADTGSGRSPDRPELRRRQVGFSSLHEDLDTTTTPGRLVFHVFAALAEFIRELTVRAPRKAWPPPAPAGPPRPAPALTPEQVRHARDLLTHPGNTVASIARLLKVSRSTIYKHIPELAGTAGGHRAVIEVEAAPSLAAPLADPPATTVRSAKRDHTPPPGSPQGTADRHQPRCPLAVPRTPSRPAAARQPPQPARP